MSRLSPEQESMTEEVPVSVLGPLGDWRESRLSPE